MMSRYSRHEVLPQIGKDGQRKLCQSSVIVVGCGSLGCITASLLARSGIGKLHLVDRDIVELQNLQHQILYEEADVGEPKALAAAAHLQAANSDIEAVAGLQDVNPSNVEALVKGKDIVLDATSRRVYRQGEEIGLTAVEFNLLKAMLQSPGQVVSRQDLIETVLGRDYSPLDRSIDVHISNLRKKLGDKPGEGERIKAIRGEGYLFIVAG